MIILSFFRPRRIYLSLIFNAFILIAAQYKWCSMTTFSTSDLTSFSRFFDCLTCTVIVIGPEHAGKLSADFSLIAASADRFSFLGCCPVVEPLLGVRSEE